MRLAHLAVALLIGIAALNMAACTGAPNREQEALDIRDQIAAMPGVSRVDLEYDNGVLEGTRFELEIDMEKASDQQIGAVASQINALRGHEFTEFDQRMEISVADGASISASADMPADTEQVTALVRRLRAEVQAQTITWFDRAASGESVVKIEGAAAPSAAVDAVLRVFADRTVNDIDVTPADRMTEPYWKVFSPLSPADKQRLDRQLAAAAPAEAGWIGVRHGRFERLTLELSNPTTAYEDLVRTINAIEAGPAHPVSLTWAWIDDPALYDQPQWAGSAIIGKCDYANGDRTKTEALQPDALQLQQRIRDEFDTCLK